MRIRKPKPLTEEVSLWPVQTLIKRRSRLKVREFVAPRWVLRRLSWGCALLLPTPKGSALYARSKLAPPRSIPEHWSLNVESPKVSVRRRLRDAALCLKPLSGGSAGQAKAGGGGHVVTGESEVNQTHQIFVLSFVEQGARLGVKAIGAFHVWVNPNVPLVEIIPQLKDAIRKLEHGDQPAPKEAKINGTDFPHQ